MKSVVTLSDDGVTISHATGNMKINISMPEIQDFHSVLLLLNGLKSKRSLILWDTKPVKSPGDNT